MKDRWILPCHVCRSNSAASPFGKRWSGSIQTRFPQLLVSPCGLEVQRPSPHVAGVHVARVHVAALFTNTLPGIPRVPCCGDKLPSCGLCKPVFHPRPGLLVAVTAKGRAVTGWRSLLPRLRLLVLHLSNIQARGLEQGRPQ